MSYVGAPGLPPATRDGTSEGARTPRKRPDNDRNLSVVVGTISGTIERPRRRTRELTKGQPVTAPAAVAEDLVKVFGREKKEVRALDGVSLRLESGTVLGLLGPNGAGKTTAVNILTTLTRPDSGRAEVAGIDVVRDPDAVRRSIGLAGQYAAVDPNLTGRENLALVGQLNHLGRSRAAERAEVLLGRFGLSDAADRRAKTYSGGMRRRLDLAAALVAEPRVLFLDEPTTGLDPRSRIDLWLIIEELVADGTSLLLTSQYLEEVDRLANAISVVDHGRVIAEGTAAELKGRLGATVVELGVADEASAVRTVEIAEAEMRADGRVGGVPSRDGTTVRIPTVSGPATIARLIRGMDDAGVTATSIAVREPSLDDVFLALTGRVTGPDTDEDPETGIADGHHGRRRGKEHS